MTLATFAPAAAPGEVEGRLAALADPVVHGALALAVALVVLAVRRGTGRGPAELAVAVLAASLVPALVSRWPWQVAAGWHEAVVAATLVAGGTALVAGAIGVRAVRALPLTAAADH